MSCSQYTASQWAVGSLDGSGRMRSCRHVVRLTAADLDSGLQLTVAVHMSVPVPIGVAQQMSHVQLAVCSLYLHRMRPHKQRRERANGSAQPM